MRRLTLPICAALASACHPSVDPTDLEAAHAQLESELDAVAEEMDALQATVEAQATTIAALQTAVDDLEGASSGADLAVLEARVSTVEAAIAVNATDIAANTSNIAANAADIDALQSSVGDQSNDIAGLQSDLAQVQTTVQGIAADYATATALAATDATVAANTAAFSSYLPTTTIQATYAPRASVDSLESRLVVLEDATYLDQSTLDAALLDYTPTSTLQTTYATQADLTALDDRVVIVEGLLGGEDVAVLADEIASLPQDFEATYAGEIRYSLLSEDEFQTLYGTSWVLMDARTVGGTDLETYGWTRLPDGRGRFLRMKDHGAGMNPDGDTALGTTQVDELVSHDHVEARDVGGGSVANGNPGLYTWSITTASSTGPGERTGATGGDETRPANVTVNVFVKVNHG